MLVLFETAAGYAIFKLLNEKKLKKTDNLFKEFESPEKASNVVKMTHFEKFEDMTEALAAATAAVEGKMNKKLKKLLKKVILKEANAETLAVADSKLGNIIKEKLNISCVHNTQVAELMRCIRSQVDSLVTGLPEKEMTAMALGLAHSLSRYKLKFSPDKVDTMIVQAVSLLDDLDKELNNYVMRAREWYGWHFPELGKIVPDNAAFIKLIKTMGMRENASSTDLSDVVSEDIEAKIKEAAEISMGTEISEEDMLHISFLCDQVIDMTDYRAQLYEYLKNRMMAIAPNLTLVVGDLVGARLISHAGSLLNLAKHPASTVQILGAEKALFRAIKAKHDTPKYGIIYHAQLLGQCGQKFKGKMARKLGCAAARCCRIDALADETNTDEGLKLRSSLEAEAKALEEGLMRRVSGTGKSKAKQDKYESKSQVFQYNPAEDVTRKRKWQQDEKESTPAAPLKKKKKVKLDPTDVGDSNDVSPTTPGSQKKKKGKLEQIDTSAATGGSSQKKKKRKHDVSSNDNATPSVEKKKKKVREDNGE